MATDAATDSGALLKEARQAANISEKEMAERLNMSLRYLKALERNDRRALPAVVFVRGYILSYARELHLDPEPLLAAFRLEKAEPEVKPVEPAVKPGLKTSPLGGRSTKVAALILALLALAAALLMALVWQGGQDFDWDSILPPAGESAAEVAADSPSALENPAEVPPSGFADAVESEADSAPSGFSDAVESEAEPAPSGFSDAVESEAEPPPGFADAAESEAGPPPGFADAAESEADSASSGFSDAVESEADSPPPALVDAVATEAEASSPEEAAEVPDAAQGVRPGPVESASPFPSPDAADADLGAAILSLDGDEIAYGPRRITPTGDEELWFEFSEDCWVEVQGGEGQLLYNNLHRQGDTLNLVGQGPFRILLGYSPGVQLIYNGERVSLAPHSRNGVASLALGQ